MSTARRKLVQLEQSQVVQQSANGQGDMFIVAGTEGEPDVHPAVMALENLDPDELTPRQALDMLYKLKKLV